MDSKINCNEILCNSDSRIKTDIRPINKKKVFDTLKKINVVTYKFINSECQERIGVIAQDLEKVAPIFVKEDVNSYHNIYDFKAVNYIEMHNLLIPATQEIIKKVEEQDKKINFLMKKLEYQAKQIHFLKNQL
jgi:hypothetical protein